MFKYIKFILLNESGFLSAIAAASASALGGLLTNSSRKREAQRNRNFQAEMSNTSYQRAVKDMEAAGLNPAVAYQQGGASTPTGDMAQIDNPLGEAVNTGVGVFNAKQKKKMADANINRINKSIDVMEAQIKNIGSDTAFKKANAAQIINSLPASKLKGKVSQGILELSSNSAKKLDTMRKESNKSEFKLKRAIDKVRTQDYKSRFKGKKFPTKYLD